MAAFDELRIGDFYADVSPYTEGPEPSTGLLLGFGVVALAMARRRRLL